MRSSRAIARTACLVAVAVAVVVPAAGVLPVVVHDRKFVDSLGRERFFRGVNVVYKDSPWIPTAPTFNTNLSFVQDDLDFLTALGVNLIRLGVMWPGLMPREGETDPHYVAAVLDAIRMCERNGVYVVIEPHQDELHPSLCGEGVPDWWATKHAPIVDFPVPVQSTPFGTSPPGRALCDSHTSFDYIWSHDCAAAFQRLYTHSKEFEEYWVNAARAFGSEPAVLAGELFNEPFPGDVFGDARNRNNTYADLFNLQPWYANISRAIRGVLPKDRFNIAYEPAWPVGTQGTRAPSSSRRL
jgi:endoglycosylceramidase